jgi:hypothetical protein
MELASSATVMTVATVAMSDRMCYIRLDGHCLDLFCIYVFFLTIKKIAVSYYECLACIHLPSDVII